MLARRIITFMVVMLATSMLRAEQPKFETGVLAPSSTEGFTSNSLPVIARLQSGRLLCVFSVSTKEKPVKLNIAFSTSDDNGKTWSKGILLFNHPGTEDADPNLIVDQGRVLAFSTTVVGPVKISQTLIYMRESDDGIHWSKEVLLKTPHRYIAGKIHQGHRLSDGTLVMGYAWDTWAEQGMPPASEGEMNIKSGVLRSTDGGKTWKPGGDMYANIPKTSPHAISGLDEPATVVLADGRLMCLMRTSSTKLFQAWSSDGGLTWSKPQPSALTAHNSPAALWKLDGQRDVVAVWDDSATGRTPLVAALSTDGGQTWSTPKILADTHSSRQVSYPSVVQAKDGTIIAVWQCQLPQGGREIHMARFNRSWLLTK